jgi:GNAT superfamily N-acetyltransferase
MAKALWRKLPACASSRSWDGQLQRYLGLIHGQPVAMSALFLAAGVAGIYEVLTLPHLRGQRVGGAMTRYPLQVARQLGYRIGVLEASPMGLPLYHHLGFHEHCQYLLFGWEPASAGRADACSTHGHVRAEMRKRARYALVYGITLEYM